MKRHQFLENLIYFHSRNWNTYDSVTNYHGRIIVFNRANWQLTVKWIAQYFKQEMHNNLNLN